VAEDVTVPEGVVILTAHPVALITGTVNTISVLETLVTVASTPQRETVTPAVVPGKPDPETVTELPGVPDERLRLAMAGGVEPPPPPPSPPPPVSPPQEHADVRMFA
jgi:hypothetical protein